MNDVNAELGYSAGTTISLEDAAVRTLAGIPTGAISLFDLYGKSSWSWSRPSSSSVSGTGTSSNLGNAYDTTGTSIDGSSYAGISHGTTGTWPQSMTVSFSGFGTGTHTGHLYIACSGSLSDTSVTAYSTIEIDVNGSSVYSNNSSGGTPVTFNSTGGSAMSVALTSQDLSTLSVDIVVTGGKVVIGDTANCSINVYDLVFK
jgi:hypothetical protein